MPNTIHKDRNSKSAEVLKKLLQAHLMLESGPVDNIGTKLSSNTQYCPWRAWRDVINFICGHRCLVCVDE
jgi:hypothetical protein